MGICPLKLSPIRHRPSHRIERQQHVVNNMHNGSAASSQIRLRDAGGASHSLHLHQQPKPYLMTLSIHVLPSSAAPHSPNLHQSCNPASRRWTRIETE